MNDRNRKHGDNKQGDRKPLDWKLEETIQCGDIRAEITAARSSHGKKFHSVSIRKIIRDRENKETGRTTGFFKRGDMSSIRDVCEQAQHWIDADTEEDRQNRDRHTGRRNRTPQDA